MFGDIVCQYGKWSAGNADQMSINSENNKEIAYNSVIKKRKWNASNHTTEKWAFPRKLITKKCYLKCFQHTYYSQHGFTIIVSNKAHILYTKRTEQTTLLAQCANYLRHAIVIYTRKQTHNPFWPEPEFFSLFKKRNEFLN